MAKKAYKKNCFTIIELIIVMIAALIVLMPIGAMMGAIIRESSTAAQVKLLQEELHLASYSVKGLIEEAYAFDIVDVSEMHLFGAASDPAVVIKQDGDRLLINDRAVIDCLAELHFEAADKLIKVTVKTTRADRTIESSFHVKMRN